MYLIYYGGHKVKPITFDMYCSYLNMKLDRRIHAMKHIPNMKNFCAKEVPYISYYQNKLIILIKQYTIILTKEVPMVLPDFNQHNKNE